jgi:hypothetical protein
VSARETDIYEKAVEAIPELKAIATTREPNNFESKWVV